MSIHNLAIMINKNTAGNIGTVPMPANVPGLIDMIPQEDLYKATGKRSNFTWDDLSKVMGMSAQLWMLIAPFIPRKNNNQPIVQVPPQPQSTDIGRIVLWVGLGLGAILLIKNV